MAFSTQLQQTSSAVDLLLKQFLNFKNHRNGGAGQRDSALQELACNIVDLGNKGVAALLRNARTADERRTRAILTALALRAASLSPTLRKKTCAESRFLLHDRRPFVVADAVDLLAVANCKSVRTQVEALHSHHSPFVIGSVLRYLSRLFPKRAIPYLLAALSSEQPIVRQNAIDELDNLEHAAALPIIQRLTKDPDKDVRSAACQAVLNLS